MQLSRSLILESILSARPGHTLWHEAADRIFELEGRFRREPDMHRSMFGIVPRLRGRGSCQLDASKKNWLSLEPGRAGSIRDAARSRTLSHCTGKLLTPSRGHGWAIYEYTPQCGFGFEVPKRARCTLV